MERRNLADIKISFDTAKRMFMQGSEFEREVALKTWPELGKKALPTCFKEIEVEDKTGYFVDYDCKIRGPHRLDYKSPQDLNVFLKIEQARASSILGALITARDIYRNGNEAGLDWVLMPNKGATDWHNMEFFGGLHLWSFQDQETAELFLENFKEQLDIIKNLY